MEVVLTNENFENYASGSLMLVADFWADWCGPCKMISPVISQLAQEYDGKYIVGKCNVEECEEIATKYGVRNIPTILFIKDGVVIDRFVGAGNKAKLQEKFEENL